MTDGEFAQVLSKVGQISNSYEAAKVLAMEKAKARLTESIEIAIRKSLVSKSR